MDSRGVELATREYHNCSWSPYTCFGTRVRSFGIKCKRYKGHFEITERTGDPLFDPVPAGSKLRGRVRILVPPNGLRVTYGITFEIEDGDRPACVAQMIAIHYQ